MQSPIDLLDRRVQVFPSLGKLKRDYKPAPAVVMNRGHDITVKWKGDAGKIKINGTEYKLEQCHWHSPSEHTFNGSRYNLELHIIHSSPSGEIAVVGIVYKYGRPDPFLSKLFHHINSVGKDEIDLGIVNPGIIKFGSRKYFRYIGSLTVPPCTEGVIWTIVKKTQDESQFTYTEESGKGPKNWGQIDADWKACSNGKMQSPIDLLDRRVQVFPSLGKLKRDYKPAPAVVMNRGHDITVKWKGDAGKIKINGTEYKLEQCHWHSPSEHTFNGSRYNLELHIIHSSPSGEIAVVGIVYKYGRPDPFLSKLFHHINSVGKDEIDLGIVNPGIIKFGSRKYFRYIGSLTVPPCTEGVIWTIVKKVRTVSREQVTALREAVHDVSVSEQMFI
ncbi:Bifunctional monodehydroascorbate reductase and carbonic anhydrase nectarin-3 [Morella rubra]|uniref:Bifunctional monodehydroascorbate reductase and carbonic anhydrase nectarin-3 n=1 Tax=Morella rubra TaxID=262757 RepID=A0A6A1WDJ9_9ROSI|nr:Bifunctional monodehydroascorbate reductase and carbonic anhydrase nectarin-3 [Morella rubra]